MAKIQIEGRGRTDESITVYAYSTSTADKWYYSLNDGDWVEYSSKQDSAETIIIEGLSPSREYKVEVRAKRKGLLIYDISNAILVKTTAPVTLSSASDVYFDEENAKITFKANIPTGILNGVGEIAFYRLNELIYHKSILVQDGENEYTFSDAVKNKFLEYLSSSKDLVFYFTISYKKQIGTSQPVSYTTGHLTFHGKTTVENSAPELTDFSFEDINNNTFAVTQNRQLLITSQSDLLVSINPATPKNYASIVAYTVTVGNVSISTVNEEVEVGKIDLSGAVPIVVTAIDSRGYTATVTKVVNYIPYNETEITDLTIERINSVEKMTYFVLNGNISPIVIDGTDKNPLKSILYQFMKTDEDSFGDLTEISKENIVTTESGFNLEIPAWLEFDEKSSYYIRVVVQDQLTQDDEIATLGNGKPVMALRKGMVGINNNNPQYAMDIDGDLNLTGRILLNGEEIDLGGITE